MAIYPEGRFWIDEVEGTVLRSELRVIRLGAEANITVTYGHDPDADTWVPVRMQERYVLRGRGVEVLGEATYATFRRFQVKTDERFER